MTHLFIDSLLHGESRRMIRRSTPPETWRMVRAADVRRLELQNAVTALLEQEFTASQFSTRPRRKK
jgi:hypothetical protein